MYNHLKLWLCWFGDGVVEVLKLRGVEIEQGLGNILSVYHILRIYLLAVLTGELRHAQIITGGSGNTPIWPSSIILSLISHRHPVVVVQFAMSRACSVYRSAPDKTQQRAQFRACFNYPFASMPHFHHLVEFSNLADASKTHR